MVLYNKKTDNFADIIDYINQFSELEIVDGQAIIREFSNYIHTVEHPYRFKEYAYVYGAIRFQKTSSQFNQLDNLITEKLHGKHHLTLTEIPGYFFRNGWSSLKKLGHYIVQHPTEFAVMALAVLGSTAKKVETKPFFGSRSGRFLSNQLMISPVGREICPREDSYQYFSALNHQQCALDDRYTSGKVNKSGGHLLGRSMIKDRVRNNFPFLHQTVTSSLNAPQLKKLERLQVFLRFFSFRCV